MRFNVTFFQLQIYLVTLTSYIPLLVLPLTGISGAELDVTTGGATAGLPIKSVDISQDPENSDVSSDATNVQVVIQNNIFGQKGAGLA